MPAETKESMSHWNGHQLCVLDTETTGVDPQYHEVVQVALVPLTSRLEIRKDVMPFSMYLKPESPQLADKDAMAKNRLSLSDLCLQGFDRDKAVDLLIAWKDKLGLGCTAYGTPKKIMLLGHNIGFDIAFMKKWMTSMVYEEQFDYHYRDTMIIANFLNDSAGLKAETVPYSKVKLQWLANKLGVEYDTNTAHDALVDCVITAKVYKKLCSVGLF